MFFKFLILAILGSSLALPNAHFHADVQVEKDGKFKDITGTLAGGAKKVVDLHVDVAHAAADLIGQVGGVVKGLVHKSKDLLDATEGKVSSIFDKEVSVDIRENSQAGGEVTGTIVINAETPKSKSATTKSCACDLNRRSCMCPDSNNPSGYVVVSIAADDKYFKLQAQGSYNQVPQQNNYVVPDGSYAKNNKVYQPPQTPDVQQNNYVVPDGSYTKNKVYQPAQTPDVQQNNYVVPDGSYTKNNKVYQPAQSTSDVQQNIPDGSYTKNNNIYQQAQSSSDVQQNIPEGNYNKDTKFFQPGYYTPEAGLTNSPSTTYSG